MPQVKSDFGIRYCDLSVNVQVTSLGADIIGALARTRLPIITGRFLKVRTTTHSILRVQATSYSRVCSMQILCYTLNILSLGNDNPSDAMFVSGSSLCALQWRHDSILAWHTC